LATADWLPVAAGEVPWMSIINRFLDFTVSGIKIAASVNVLLTETIPAIETH